MSHKIFRIEWKGFEKGKEVIKSGYFIKIMNKYYQIFYEGTHFEKEDNDVIDEYEVQLNILGQFKKI